MKQFPLLPTADALARHVEAALRAARCDDWPYRHWLLDDVLPEAMCVGLLALPIAPPLVGNSLGKRETFNRLRSFFTPALYARHPASAVLAEALQRPNIARAFAEVCGIDPAGSFLRIEYIQDLNGMWLEPHCDIPEKLFSMVVYLCTGPDAKDWGTDIYDSERRWVGRASAEFDSAVIFVPGENTWHGFEPRPIDGVRRLLEINYVRDWHDRDQLAYPDRPIVT